MTVIRLLSKSLVGILRGIEIETPFVRPSMSFAITDRVLFQPSNCSPFGDTTALAMSGNDNCDRPIAILFQCSRPAAVIRRVRAIIIDSIERCSVRSMSHICKELLKGLNPLRADRYAATSVFGISGIVWLKAALLHCLPGMPCWGASSSMGSFNAAHVLALETAATCTSAALKLASTNDSFCSANTDAIPERVISIPSRWTHNSPASKSSVSQVKLLHACIIHDSDAVT